MSYFTASTADERNTFQFDVAEKGITFGSIAFTEFDQK